MSTVPNVKALEGAIFASLEERLGALLERGLGLAQTANNLAAFAEQCRYRAAGLGLSESAYHDLLAAGGPSVRSEWLALSPVLTVGETFLFRDNALWKMIELELLPGLAKLTKPLWLWSAGCSTGEEAYTLAIIARRRLAAGSFSVLGTDVNPKAIAAARVGAYTQWSLRGVDRTQLDGLIISGTQTVRVHDDVKKDARFETHNLLDEGAYPPGGLASFECIVCRNVLIYMTLDARAAVIARLASCLTPGGALVLGHGEATGVDLAGLAIERHDAGVVYRKSLGTLDARIPSPQAKTGSKRVGAKSKEGARTSRIPTRSKVHAVRPAPNPAPAQAGTAEAARAQLALAAKEARMGQTEAAERHATLAMSANPLDPEPHVLLAALYAARDAFKQAEAELRRALFLDPACIPALWQLGTLYRITDRDRHAALTFARLLARLDGLPPEQVALPFDHLTVAELTTLLRAALGETANG